jgi:hypothetical protein
MAKRFVACSSRRFEERALSHGVSVLITIRSTGSTNGKPIYASSVSQKSKRFLIFPGPIPFIERLIGTIRRECLGRSLFWTAIDLEMKLVAFQDYYNRQRTNSALEGRTPIEGPKSQRADLKCYRWQTHSRGLYQTPIAA